MKKVGTTQGNESRKSRDAHRSQASSRGERSSSLNGKWLKDFLSEMLAVEIGGVKLYKKALNELQHSENEEKLNEFLLQTERHVELCTEMLRTVGSDSNYRSPGAQAAEHKAEGLISTQ